MAEFSIFGQESALTYFDNYLLEIKKEIDEKSNEYILNVNVDDWKGYFMNKYDFQELTVYPETVQVDLKGKGKTKQESRDGSNYLIDTYNFELSIHYTGWYYLFSMRPSRRELHNLRISVPSKDEGILVVRFSLYEQNPQRFEAEKTKILRAIMNNIPNINSDLRDFKSKISGYFDKVYNQKKQKVIAENSFFENIKITTNRETDKIFKVPLLEKTIVPEPVIDKKTNKLTIETPSFPDENYNDIINVINIFYKALEKKPATYKLMDEEGLRDYILPSLELRFNNTTVTGETFNKAGKTDILMRYVDGTNIFVAELKFWKGEATLHETINQLFEKYLTWRDSKVAIIFFVKNKEFSKVLSTIKESVTKHPYFVRHSGGHGDSSFSYIFKFPDDNQKFVFTEVMAFHFV